ncbi:sugar phosphate isomerase/epimerase family protein [Schlesneria paludicola]|uniref:sugar phosphate isomerase/epimerase family protein n=1 Tax=Schlesneria paludicola TaxID=360056 RepID=UPI0003177F84|nr:sugar phosphate isomerase/epimerase family protein [Schlesneria paludicola]
MIRSAVTVSLVTESKGGPFVFWDDLPAACRQAKELGFDAIELFAPCPDAVSKEELTSLLTSHELQLAAVGTGAGWVKHKLTLTSADAHVRRRAIDFIRSMIDFGGVHGAPAIIGSMQGRWGDGVSKDQAMTWLTEALNELGEHARQHGVPLIYEPLNRYETNLVNTVSAGVDLMKSLKSDNVKLLSDLFHMNIEESDLAAAIRGGGPWIGHIHFVDSNRRPAGCGHLNFAPIVAALQQIGYGGYLSAEALSWPDAPSAAEQTIHEFRRLFGSSR